MEPAVKTKKIVIVEDNVDLAEIYKTRLDVIGYNCIIANDGIAALYLIQKELPDLVLLDLMVPNIAGDQILARMRANDWGQKTPVVIISNLDERDAPKGLREMGIVDYAVKANITTDQLDKMVDGILKPNAQPQAAMPAAVSAGPGAQSASQPPAVSQPIPMQPAPQQPNTEPGTIL